MTITLPLRFIILHFSHIGFTDDLTFIVSSYAHKSFIILYPTRARKNFTCRAT